MYVIYSQMWSNGRTSYHRSPSDIPEFGVTQNPPLTRNEQYQQVSNVDYTAIKVLEGKLGVWRQ